MTDRGLASGPIIKMSHYLLLGVSFNHKKGIFALSR